MKNLRKSIVYIVIGIAIIVAASCQKDNTIQYNNTTMGNIVDGRFVSDQGNIFNVVEQNCEGRLDSAYRAIVLCDVLNRTEGGLGNEYDIRLNAFSRILTKEIIPAGTLTEEDTDRLTEDPIRVDCAWISGGYLNVYFMFPVKIGSNTAHLINLVEIVDEEAEGYSFTLRHNAFTETLTPENISQYKNGWGYASFPLSSFIEGEKAQIKLNWKWYKEFGGGISTETKDYSITGTYVKNGHYNVPEAINLLNVRKVLQN